MAVSPGTSNSNKRKEFARAMNTIAVISNATTIGQGGTAGGMYNAAKTANASAFSALYAQTRGSAADLLAYMGLTVNTNTFLDTKAKLLAVADQIKTEFYACSFPVHNTTGAIPGSWGVASWPVCGSLPSTPPYTASSTPPSTGDGVYDDLPDDNFVDDSETSDTGDDEDGMSVATKVGIGVAVTAVTVGLLVAVTRR